MQSLIDTIISVKKARGRLYSAKPTVSWRDWNVVGRAFNEKFGGTVKVDVLECAIWRERYRYEIALFRERCRVAKEEQQELGEE